jgi:hypothetical protein
MTATPIVAPATTSSVTARRRALPLAGALLLLSAVGAPAAAQRAVAGTVTASGARSVATTLWPAARAASTTRPPRPPAAPDIRKVLGIASCPQYSGAPVAREPWAGRGSGAGRSGERSDRRRARDGCVRPSGSPWNG